MREYLYVIYFFGNTSKQGNTMTKCYYFNIYGPQIKIEKDQKRVRFFIDQKEVLKDTYQFGFEREMKVSTNLWVIKETKSQSIEKNLENEGLLAIEGPYYTTQKFDPDQKFELKKRLQFLDDKVLLRE